MIKVIQNYYKDFQNHVPFCSIWGYDAIKSIEKEKSIKNKLSKYVEFGKWGCVMTKPMPESLVHTWFIRKTSLNCCQIFANSKFSPTKRFLALK
jgi:hypothetical protein